MNRSNGLSRQRLLINYLLVYLLLFISGSWRYNLAEDRYLVIGFVIATVAWYLYSDRRFSYRFLLYVVLFSLVLFFISIYTSGSLALTSVVASILKLVLPYFVIKTLGNRFIETYLNVIVFLAAVSLLGYLSDTFNLMDGLVRKLPKVGEMGYEGFLYVFRFPWHIERNNSIFFEPGAYQAFINAALFLLFFIKTSFSIKKTWTYIAVLVIALITTFSTAGFLIFMVMFVMFLFRSTLLTHSGKAVLLGLSFALVAALSTQFYSTVIVKVNDYMNANEYDFGYSAQNRSSDAKTDLKVFRKHFFGVGYDEYYKEFGILGRVGADRGYSSNGVTKMLAVYGLPFSLFIFISYCWALKRALSDIVLAGGAYIMFMMFLAAESYYMMSPICFAIIAGAFLLENETGIVAETRDQRV